MGLLRNDHSCSFIRAQAEVARSAINDLASRVYRSTLMQLQWLRRALAHRERPHSMTVGSRCKIDLELAVFVRLRLNHLPTVGVYEGNGAVRYRHIHLAEQH